MNDLGKRVTVAMISMNEEGSVATVIHNIQQALPGAEIVLVDSSQDKTPFIAATLGVNVIRQFPPRGYGWAMITALRESSGEIVITMDCDDTYPADKIPDFAALMFEKNYDVIDASRLRRKPKAMPWLNYLANVFFASIASLLFGRKLTDLHSGMRAYRKSMLDALTFRAEGAALPVELLLKPIVCGYQVHVEFIDHEHPPSPRPEKYHTETLLTVVVFQQSVWLTDSQPRHANNQFLSHHPLRVVAD